MIKHPQFVISGVTMNWEEDILSAIDVAFILDVPADERVKRDNCANLRDRGINGICGIAVENSLKNLGNIHKKI